MKGAQRVQRVISKFDNLVAELDKGVIEMEEEVKSNTSVIDRVETMNGVLAYAIARAHNVASNLRKITGD